MKIAFQTGADIVDERSREAIFNNLNDSINPLLQGLYRRGINEVFHYNSTAIENTARSLNGTGYWLTIKSLSKEGKLRFTFRIGTEILDNFDLIFVRGDDINLTTIEHYLLIDSLIGVTLINSGAGTLITRDKFLIPQRYSQHLDAIPNTLFASNLDDLTEAWDTLKGDEIVLKGRYGTGGREVEKFPRTQKGLLAGHKHLKMHGDIVAQEFHAEISEGDVRIMAFDSDLIGGFKRLPKERWLTNVTGGGVMEPIELSPQLIRQAELALRLYPDIRYQGMDLIYTTGMFIETNAFPASLGVLNLLYGGRHEDRILDKLIA